MKFKILMMALLLTITVAASAQPPGGGRGGDPTQRAEKQSQMMVDSLSLSTKQAEKVKEINLEYAQKQVEARSANTDGDWDKMRATLDVLRTEQNVELKAVLTNDQYDRWLKIAASQPGRGRGGPPPPVSAEDGNEKKDKKSKKEKKGTPPPPPPPPVPVPLPEKEGSGN